MRRAALALPLAAILLSGRAAAEEAKSQRPLLARAADDKDPGHDEALAAWKTLAPQDKAALARRSLRSSDPGTALVAAIAADPETLDLEELHLQAAAQAPDPLARLMTPPAWAPLRAGVHAFGSKDLPAIWAALGKRDPGPKDLDGSALHRSLLPEEIPALVPLLETVGPKTFLALLDDLRTVSEQQAGPEHRGDFVRAFRYALARIRATAAKRRPPTLASLPALPAKPGLPSEFVEIAKATWIEDPGFATPGKPPQETSSPGPAFWLHHWAMETTPAEEDVPFLLSLIEGKRTLEQTRRWAARRIASFAGEGGLKGRASGHTLQKVLGLGDAAGLFAAAERAARGDTEPWKRLAGKDAKGLVEARWIADPAAAEKAVTDLIVRGELPKDLEEADRLFWENDFGVVVPDAALERIADRLAGSKVPLSTEAWFYGAVLPESLTRERAERLASTWAARAGDADPREKTTAAVLARLDAVAPEATLAMLREWAKAAPKEQKPRVAALLARVGDASMLDALLAAWPEGEEERRFLGRIRDPKVETFLRERAASQELGEQSAAVAALAIFHGCPESLAAIFVPPVGGPSEGEDPAWERAKALVLAKDPIGGAVEFLRPGRSVSGQAHFAGLALSKDPRALDLLRSWRASRTGASYFEATSALALAGDPAARDEWKAFLGENRAFLLDQLQDGTLGTLDGDPEWTSFWVTQFDANCCHAWHAHLVLSGAYPTLPFTNGPGDEGRARKGAERWFAKHKGTFVRSRILDGWVPGPAK